MISHFSEKERFITLLAHANCDVLPQFFYQNANSTLVLTDTYEEASTTISNKKFNLIIVDMELNGLDLVRSVKMAACINCYTPIIALINQSEIEQRQIFITAGFDDYLLKPLSEENFCDAIKLWRDDKNISMYIESINNLLTIFRDNKAVVLTLYTKLYEDLPKQVEIINVGLKTGQYKIALDAAHSVNGFAKVCHLKNFEDLTESLKECLKLEKYELADGYFSMLQNATESFINQRQSILQYLEE